MESYFFNFTCAVVGSSSNLLEHKNGNLIDNHSIVIRSNYAPTFMYDEYVGKKRMPLSYLTTCIKKM